jgi:hypothetical protein
MAKSEAKPLLNNRPTLLLSKLPMLELMPPGLLPQICRGG